MKIVATTLAALAFVVPVAYAHEPSEQTSMSIAKHVWGPAPCGQPTIKYDRDGLAAFVSEPAGWVMPDSCVIHLNPSVIAHPVYRCSVIVHEWGHLTGHKHSPDLGNVMHSPVPSGYWRCWHAYDKEGK